MHTCVQNLLKVANSKAEPERVECLCKLMATIGSKMDNKRNEKHMKQYFLAIKSLSRDSRLDMRLKFMLQDLEELRGSRWRERRKTEKESNIRLIEQESEEELLDRQEKIDLHRCGRRRA